MLHGHDAAGRLLPAEAREGCHASLRRRIEIFISLPFATLDRMAAKARLDKIGGAVRA